MTRCSKHFSLGITTTGRHVNRSGWWAAGVTRGRDVNVMKRLRNLSAVAGWDEDKDINKMNQDIIQTGTGRQI